MWKSEDYWTVWLGFLLIIATVAGLVSRPVLPGVWGSMDMASPLASFSGGILPGLITTGLLSLFFFALAVFVVEKEEWKKFIKGFPFLYALVILSFFLGNYVPFSQYGLDNVIWALVIGLLISNTFGTPAFLRGAAKTELFIKTGLVLMGASVLFNRFLSLGLLGLGVAWLVTPLVLIFMYWFSQRFLGMKDSRGLAITIASAASVCGVSAAIAVGTASKAKKEEISLAISVTLMFTVFMMLLMPHAIRLLGIELLVGGALIGGTIDATGAVLAAGSMLGEEAMEVAAIIKMLQNLLIGFIAFAIAIYWVAKYERGESSKGTEINISEIWLRLPKFVIGFMAASILFSFILPSTVAEETLPVLNSYRGLFFTLAFVSIGLNSNFKYMLRMIKKGSPVLLYVVGQGANIILTFIAAWVFFSGRFFDLPL